MAHGIVVQDALGRADVLFGIFGDDPLRGGVGSTTFLTRLGLYERSAFTRPISGISSQWSMTR